MATVPGSDLATSFRLVTADHQQEIHQHIQKILDTFPFNSASTTPRLQPEK